MEHRLVYDSRCIGNLLLIEKDGFLTELRFLRGYGYAGRRQGVGGAIAQACDELDEYFLGKRRHFDVPLKPKGTKFQLRVWKVLMSIPYGSTFSYADVARASGLPKGYRAVGNANNRNPIAIMIPCHRVIGSNGKLLGYGGGLDIKRYLLDMEARNR